MLIIVSASHGVAAENAIYWIGAISGVIAVVGCVLGGLKLVLIVSYLEIKAMLLKISYNYPLPDNVRFF